MTHHFNRNHLVAIAEPEARVQNTSRAPAAGLTRLGAGTYLAISQRIGDEGPRNGCHAQRGAGAFVDVMSCRTIDIASKRLATVRGRGTQKGRQGGLAQLCQRIAGRQGLVVKLELLNVGDRQVRSAVRDVLNQQFTQAG